MAGHTKKNRFVGVGGDVPAKGKQDPKAKSGLVGKIKSNVKKKKQTLADIMKQVKKAQRR